MNGLWGAMASVRPCVQVGACRGPARLWLVAATWPAARVAIVTAQGSGQIVVDDFAVFKREVRAQIIAADDFFNRNIREPIGWR